jgi:hypothetical protein
MPCNQMDCWGTQWTPNGKQLIDLGPIQACARNVYNSLQIATVMYMFCIFWTLILVIRRGLALTRSNAHAMLIQIVLGL